MRGLKSLILMVFAISGTFNGLFAEECPLIFVHGIQSNPKPSAGWPTWNNQHSAMRKILNEEYGGYKWGLTSTGDSAYQCYHDTELMNMTDSKRIYHFSYYNHDGSPGVIGTNGSYYPVNYTTDYIESANKSCYAEHLANFINKVLNATGGTRAATKVDIITHSQGGLVARSAITYYGSQNKVRKLLTLGTPHHTYEEHEWVEFLVANIFSGYRSWQKTGELLELGVLFWGPGDPVMFYDVDNPDSLATFCDWLEWDDPQITTACIAGNKPSDISWLFAANDGMVKVPQAHLSYAEFNPTIYATHFYYGVSELALVTSSYAAEYIKKWIIDDEVIAGAGSISDQYVYPTFYGGNELRFRVLVDSYQNILTTQISMIRKETGQLVEARGFPLYHYSKGVPGDPVYSTNPNNYDTPRRYVMLFRSYDMGGLVGNHEDDPTFFEGNPASVTLLTPNGGEDWEIFSFHEIRWSDDLYFHALFHKLYYKVELDDWKFIAQVDGNETSYLWQIPVMTETSNGCKVMIKTYLDVKTYLSYVSGYFTISVQDWQPYSLQSPDKGEDYIELTWNNNTIYQGYDSVQIWRHPDIDENDIWGRIDYVPNSTNQYTDSPLTRNAQYQYKVRAWIDECYSLFSNIASVTTPWLSRPTDFQAIPGSYDSIRLEWVDNSQLNTGYQVQYKIESGGIWHDTEDQPVGDVNFLDVRGVAPQTQYYFQVRAYDDDNHYSYWYDEVDPVFMKTVRDFTAIPLHNAAVLEWKTPDPAKVPFITKALIVRALGGAVNFDPVDGETYDVGSSAGNGIVVFVGDNNQNSPYNNSYYDENLVDGSTYFYKCFAFSEFPEDPDDPYYTGGVEESVVPANYVGNETNASTRGNNARQIAVSSVNGDPNSEIIHVTFAEVVGANHSTRYMYSVDHGESWIDSSHWTMVYHPTGWHPCIAVRDNITPENDSIIKLVVFSGKHGISGDFQACYRYFLEDWRFWFTANFLTSEGSFSNWGSIVIDADTAYITWSGYTTNGQEDDYTVKFAYFDIDDWFTGEPTITVTGPSSIARAFPSIAVSRVNDIAYVHVAHQRGTTNGGWEQDGYISHRYGWKESGDWYWEDMYNFTDIGVHPSLSSGPDNTAYLVYHSKVGSNKDDIIVFRYFANDNWSEPEEIADLPTQGSGNSHYYPEILSHNGNCYVAWQEPTSAYDYQIFYKERNADGEWSNTVNLSEELAGCVWPSMAFSIDYSKIYAIWTQRYEGVVFSDIDLLPTVSATSPSQGVVWHCGEEEDIMWEATDNTEGLIVQSIEYSINGGESWILIASEVENTEDYPWTVPYTPSENCKVKITVRDHAGNLESAESDIFTISDNTLPEVTLICPDGDEYWNIGDTGMIRWEASDNHGIASQLLYYSTDGGNNWVEITEGVIVQQEDEYFCSWLIPVIYSPECRIKVVAYDFSDNSGEDISENDFTIWDYESPEVTLLAPNGGEKIEVGSSYDIIWEATDNVEVVDHELFYSTDYGMNWTEIPIEEPMTQENPHVYSWDVPETASQNCLVKVESYDGVANIDGDISDNLFGIFWFLSLNIDATGHSPKIVKRYNELHLVYSSGDTIYYSKSWDDGQSFTSKLLLGFGHFPTIVSGGDENFYVLWTSGNEIYYKRHIDVGWLPEVMFHNTSEVTEFRQVIGIVDASDFLQIATEGKYDAKGRVTPRNIVYHGKMLKDSPSSFTCEKVEENLTLDNSASISFAIDANDVGYIAFSHNGEVYCYSNELEEWGDATNIGYGSNPSLNVYYDYIHIVWENEELIKHRQRHILGNWLDEETVSIEPGVFSHPIMGEGCVVVYTAEPQPQVDHVSDIVYRIRNKGVWEDRQYITENMHSDYPQIYIEKQRATNATLYTLYTEGSYPLNSIEFDKREITATHQTSSTPYATAFNSQRKLVIDTDNTIHVVYQDYNSIMYTYSFDEGETFSEDMVLGAGTIPALSSYTDVFEKRILGAVWVNDREMDFSRYEDISGWSEPYALYVYGGPPTDLIQYAPPSLIIDDEGFGHLAWAIIHEPSMYPGYVSYELHYSKFDAGLEQPTIIEDDILDNTTEWVDEGYPDINLGSPSIDIDNDNNPIIVWSRAIGEGKTTVYLKQKGANWPAEPEIVSIPEDTSIHPFCDVDYSKVHVVWEDEGIVKYRGRPLAGIWIDIEIVSNTFSASRNPQILDGDICVYTEEPQEQPNHHSYPVYSMRSGSGNWLPSNAIEATPYYSEYPQSYIYDSSPSVRILHTVWTEGNETPYGIKASSCEVPGILLITIYGYIYDGGGEPTYDPEVTITNLTTNEEWTATVATGTNYYGLALNRTDINVDDILRITAKKELIGGGDYDPEGYTYTVYVTDHEVTQDDIDNGEINEDISLDHYCINYFPDYQYFTQEQPSYSGAAVMQMWTDFKGLEYTQDDLQAMGLSDNTEADQIAGLPYVDPQGMALTLKDIIDLPPGHTFTVGVMPGDDDGRNWAMHRICWWQYTGPGALPTSGDYSHWMSVRGIHTDKRPQDGHYGGSQGDWEYDVYGFWINDPDNSPASLGANSYKTADEWTSTYYTMITDPNNPEWDGKYITVLEPPEGDAKINIVSPKPRFNDQQRGQLRTLGIIGAIPKHIRDWIIQAAIDGVTEELIPYDESFETVFNTTIPGTPFFIKSIYGNDYFAVPFNLLSLDIAEPLPVPQIKPIPEDKPIPFPTDKPVSEIKPNSNDKPISKKEPIPRTEPIAKVKPVPEDTLIRTGANTKIVVLIDAEDGSFKEASWSDNTVIYLPISREEAHLIAIEFAKELGPNISKEIYNVQPELVYRHSSPYYPEWRIIIDGHAIYVSQDGNVYEGEGEGDRGADGTMSSGVGNTPFIYSLKPVSPNPFINNAVINFSIAKPGYVSLNIYDISGRLIKTLIKEKRDAGVYRVKWNGQNNNNKKVAAGIYFTRLKSDSFTSVKKVILVR